jgi:hypothetical protein
MVDMESEVEDTEFEVEEFHANLDNGFLCKWTLKDGQQLSETEDETLTHTQKKRRLVSEVRVSASYWSHDDSKEFTLLNYSSTEQEVSERWNTLSWRISCATSFSECDFCIVQGQLLSLNSHDFGKTKINLGPDINFIIGQNGSAF